MKGETEVREEGEDGKRSISSDVVIENGKVTSKKTIEKKVVKEDKDKVVMVGTKLDDGLNEDGSYRFVPCTVEEDIENSEEYKAVQGAFEYNGPVLTRSRGSITKPSRGLLITTALSLPGPEDRSADHPVKRPIII